MHDLDRTLRTYDNESESDMEWEAGDYEEEYDTEGEYDQEYDQEFEPEYDQEYDRESGALSEEEENELAAELLTLSNEAELDQFLGKFLKRIGGGLKKAFNPLRKVLRPLAKKLLPIAGTAVGTFFGGPAGAAIGGKAGAFASKLFETDFESMPAGEREMDVARRFIRFASAAAQEVADAPDDADPNDVTKTAVANAASAHAPGLAQKMEEEPDKTDSEPPAAPASPRGNSGTWFRRRGVIIVRGA